MIAGFIPILIIIWSVIYPKIQSELKILRLVVRNILKSIRNTPTFLKAYRWHLLKLFLLVIILVFVAYQLTFLLSPLFLFIPDETKTKNEIIFPPIIGAATLYAIAIFLLSARVKLNSDPIVTFLFLFILLMSLLYAFEAFIGIIAVEVYLLNEIYKKIKSR